MLLTCVFAERFSPDTGGDAEGCFAMDVLGTGSSAHAAGSEQPETLTPAGHPRKSTIRRKVLQAKFREMSGKILVSLSKIPVTGGEGKR